MDAKYVIPILGLGMFAVGLGIVIGIADDKWRRLRLRQRIQNSFEANPSHPLLMEEILIVARELGLSKHGVRKSLQTMFEISTASTDLTLRKYCLEQLKLIELDTAYDKLPDNVRNNLLKIRGALNADREYLVLNLVEAFREHSKKKQRREWLGFMLSFAVGSISIAGSSFAREWLNKIF